MKHQPEEGEEKNERRKGEHTRARKRERERGKERIHHLYTSRLTSFVYRILSSCSLSSLYPNVVIVVA